MIVENDFYTGCIHGYRESKKIIDDMVGLLTPETRFAEPGLRIISANLQYRINTIELIRKDPEGIA